MTILTIIYILVFIIFALLAYAVLQIKLLYVFLGFAISYLVVNCLYDFSYYFRSLV